ncbi:conjugal transfer protein TrbE [Pseudodesulfovibrio tunisiensis]|uniref:VirB4 family type IV secretion/conjugal transfer ATPase n=1 Tax=Pseudodesulfovibrio tunisiensis TaxID=463192 RepID=UPI001FB5014D|nr:conjugal transfer protein TrbE [Pseudodesulfovibrio tunisiensis]
MLHLTDYRENAKGLPDLLPYAAMLDNGVVLCKDGSFLAAWEFRAQDTASSTDEELAFVSERVNQAFKNMDSGWMCHVDALRTPADGYPEPGLSHFPDCVTRTIDNERRLTFETCGAYYATRTVLSLTYRPELTTEKLNRLVYTNNRATSENPLTKHLSVFKTRCLELEDALASVMRLERLGETEFQDEHGVTQVRSALLSYLQECVTGTVQPVNLPQTPMYLDAVLGGVDLVGGLAPRVDGRELAVLSLDGLPLESWPAMLSALEGLPLASRFCSRFIFMDQVDALKELDRYRKTWRQQVFRIFDAMFNNPNARANRDALRMSEDAEEAIAAVQGAQVGAGFYTSCIVLMHEDANLLRDWTRELRREIQSLGFGCRIENVNALEAWLGTHPGNFFANVRRPMINTLNFADLLPLASIWPGRETNPSPLFPVGSPPLMQCATDGATPFRLNLHVGDLGHTLIFGPTGAGKSTLLGILAAQFRRYAGATVFCFDKGRSMYALCKAVGGTHYDVGSESDELAFCPLQHVDSEAEQGWAEEYVGNLVALQGVDVLPAHRNAMHQAMLLLRESPADMRSLTDFYHLLQDQELRAALEHYTTQGAMGRLLDAQTDTMNLSDFMVFELEELMNLGEKNLIPVLLNIFHRMESRLHGQPALLVLDEAWIMLGHPVFRAKIREWLKVMRKANVAVVLATQSLSDAVDSGIFDVLVESCPTKILLPNLAARQDRQVGLYQGMGLNSRQIDIVAQSVPKQDYYVISPEGRRLISLALGPLALSFVGVSDKESIAEIRKLEAEFGRKWPEEWVRLRRSHASFRK